MSKKISNFTAKTSVPSGSYFDLVYNGANYKILDSNFYTSIGVTGTLVVSGNPLAVPVLDIAGSVNKIRNIDGGFGVDVTLDALDTVCVSVDYSFNANGIAPVDDISASAVSWRSFFAGSGIAIAETAGEIQISATATPSSSKTITISQKSDLPTPSARVITLVADTQYLFLDNVSLVADRLVVGANTVISAADAGLITLTYTGSGAMITSVNNSCRVTSIKLLASSGSYFDLTGAGAGAESFIARNCLFVGCSSFGTITNWGLTVIAEGSSVNAGDGLVFAGTQVRTSTTQFSWTNTAGTIIDLGTATFDVIYIGPNVTFNTVSGVTGLNMAADSANINTGGRGTAVGNSFKGAGTTISGYSSGDLLWDFGANEGVEDTTKDSLSYNTAGTTVTIATVDTPVIVGGTWVDDNSNQFTVDGSGTVTYNGIESAHLPINAVITAAPSSGSNKDYTVYIAINGSPVVASGRSGRASSTDKHSISPLWQYKFETGDTCSLMLENNSDATNFDVTHAIIRVN